MDAQKQSDDRQVYRRSDQRGYPGGDAEKGGQMPDVAKAEREGQYGNEHHDDGHGASDEQLDGG
ncbi:hypothetical protein GCM10010486_00910 [Nonomuraea roseoviolacea subsp. carminata]